ncbi:glucan 1,4-alpha-glucosidase [Methylocystis heyeri]|uniref:glucan 1,4-alpha-glucosidase n=2 Tax=Methylocystis heyeri TaxID=391905 RepID=A0A6B8KMM9_9HYPH|nr:glucan 1,4-alpha-glucosidase [Methylocystis heyeri]
MLRAVSATALVKERPSFGQTIRPVRGSVLASPETASYDPNPDYFFHWLRDSAIVVDALRTLIEEKALGPEAAGHLDDFVDFSLGLCRLNGPEFLQRGDFRARAAPEALKWLRSDEELAQVVGDRALGEVRYNADGSFDLIKWSRPQNDGPALRALTIMRFTALPVFCEPAREDRVRALIDYDLDYTLAHWREPCFDLWEEVSGHHYYTRAVQYAALTDGAVWLAKRGDATRAQKCKEAAQELLGCLADHYAAEGVYLSRVPGAAVTPLAAPPRRLDIATPLAAVHARRAEGPHSVLDPVQLNTLARIEEMFDAEYPINHGRGADCAPALGRYSGDVYYSGGAYYFSTLGAAEFYYRFAEAVAKGLAIPVSADNRAALSALLREPEQALAGDFIGEELRERLFTAMLDRGDAYMATVRKYVPQSGELSEQFSQQDGTQTSAKNLAWSYACFITACAARAAARRL